MKRALPTPSFATVAFTLGLTASVAAADVIVVDDDGGPGVDHTTFDAALAAARALDPGAIADATGLDPAQVAAFYGMFRNTKRVVTVFSQGVNQSAGGTDKVNARGAAVSRTLAATSTRPSKERVPRTTVSSTA